VPVHPECQSILDISTRNGVLLQENDHLARRRAYASTTTLFRHNTPKLDSIANLVFTQAEANLKIRLYRPKTDNRKYAPSLIFFHGGGWAFGDLDSHDHICRYISGKAGVVVISVDYRLAPENKFPSAFHDACAATRWIYREAKQLGLDPHSISIGGDSAGGNLAAATTLALKNEFDLLSQILVYPALDLYSQYDSRITNGSGYMLTTEDMERFIGWYLNSESERQDWRASPLLAQVHDNLPPAIIIGAEYDPLRDEAKVYADILRNANVSVNYRQFNGMIHGFVRMGAKVSIGIAALDYIADKLNAHLKHC
jgi:acetyl esterase